MSLRPTPELDAERTKDGPVPSQREPFYRAAPVPSTSREGGEEGSENPNKTVKTVKAGPCLPTVPRGHQGPGDRDLLAPQQPPAKLGWVVVYPMWVHAGPLKEDRSSNDFFFIFFFSLSSCRVVSPLVNGLPVAKQRAFII